MSKQIKLTTPSPFSSRKWLVTMIVLVVAVVLVVFDKISGTEFLSLITANAGIYNMSNALSKGKIEIQ